MQSNLIGSWQLTSFTLAKGGEVVPWRQDVTGLLIYSADGAMSVAMNSKQETADDLFDSILFYSGTWTTDEDKVHHHVANATDVTNIGKTLTRAVRIEGDDLELSATGDFGRASVTWRRRRG